MTAKVTETKKLTFAELATLGLDELKKLATVAVRLFEKIETARKGERDERKQNAKYVAELRRRYVAGKDGGTIPLDWTFPKWAETIVGGKIPGRLQSLAALFNSLVLMNGADGKPLITEAVYDNAALDWLEKANAIVNAAQKADGENWMSSQDVQDCIAALNTPGDAAEKLDAIRKRQKGIAEPVETDSLPLTAERAVEYLVAFFDTQKGVLAKKPEKADAANLFLRLTRLNTGLSAIATAQDDITDAFGAQYDAETLQAWAKEATTDAPHHIEVITAHPETTETVAVENLGSLIPTPEEEKELVAA
jgi:hypothetical protein